MYGLIGKITAAPGQRDALISILLDVRYMTIRVGAHARRRQLGKLVRA